eukprot:Skav208597  [mRNA]  locus=scaffold598:113768:122812:+ [translate_table: standard]
MSLCPSILGREVVQLVSRQFLPQKGATPILHHLASPLKLEETLREQGIKEKTATLSCTYVPSDLLAALRFVTGFSTSEEATAVAGITWIEGEVSSKCLYDLPGSLDTLILHGSFNDSMDRVTLPSNLQTLTFGYHFNQSLDALGFRFPSPSNGKAVPEPLGKGKAVPGPTGKAKAVPEPLGKGDAVLGPKGKGNAVPGPTGKGNAVPEPKGKGETVPGPTGKSKAVPEPKGKGNAVRGPQGSTSKGTVTSAEPTSNFKGRQERLARRAEALHRRFSWVPQDFSDCHSKEERRNWWRYRRLA